MTLNPRSPALRRPVAWLALFALLAGLLLPTLAHAVALALGDDRATVWTEICTAQGMKRVPVADHADAPDDPPALSLHGAMDHCPWCLLAQGPALAPPPAPWVLPLLPALRGAPERFFTAPRTPHPWCTAQPRGPPVQG